MKKELEYYLSAYAIFMHKRRLPSEKEQFLKNNVAIYTNAGHETKIELSSNNKDVRHIVVGDINKAKRVIMTSYDLTNRTILPSFYFYPMDLDKSKSYEVFNICLSLVILLAACVGSGFAFQLVANYGLAIKILVIAICLVILYAVYKWIFSPCKNNLAQDYFLSLIYALADNVEGDDVAYVLCDNSRVNYFGMRDYLSVHKDELKNKEIIVLSELVSDKDLTILSKDGKDKFDGFITIKDNKKHNILKYINKGFMITGGNNVNDEVVIYNHRNNKTKPISIESLENLYKRLEKISKRK